MRVLLNIFLAIFIVGCVDSEDLVLESYTEMTNLTFKVEVSDALVVSTRADSETTIDELSLLLFDEQGEFVGRYSATYEDPSFRAVIPTTAQPCTIHFVANYDWSTFDVEQSVGLKESTLIPTLQSSESAFWQRVEFASGLSEDSFVSSVSLLRNVAKVSLEAVDGVALSGVKFALYNTPSLGSVAPYDSLTDSFSSVITEASDATFDTILSFGSDPQYSFERYNSDDTKESLFVILKGVYDSSKSFYKLDIIDADGNPYDIERNVCYNITVWSVEAAGYSSAAEAAASPASNSVDATIEVLDFPVVTDGEYILSVDKTAYVFTQNGSSFQTIATYQEVEGEFYNDEIIFTLNQDESAAVVVGELSYDAATGVLSAEIADVPMYGAQYTATIDVEAGNMKRRIYLTLKAPFEFEDVAITPDVIETMADDIVLTFSIPEDAESLLPFECYITAEYLSSHTENLSIAIVDGTYRYVWLATEVGQQSIVFENNTPYSTEIVYIDAELFDRSQVPYYNSNSKGLLSNVSFSPNPIPFGVGQEVSLHFTALTTGKYSIATNNLTPLSGSVNNGVYKYNATEEGEHTIDFVTAVENSSEMVIISASWICDYEIYLANPLITFEGYMYESCGSIQTELLDAIVYVYIGDNIVGHIVTSEDSNYFNISISAGLGDDITFEYVDNSEPYPSLTFTIESQSYNGDIVLLE